jgi:hypothetical protein
VRAALLCSFVVGNLLQAIPFPRKPIPDDERATWRARDIDLWYRWFGPTGLIGTREAFQEEVVDGYLLLKDAGDWIQAPVRPYFHAIRSTQQWGLFAVVTERPERLVVDVEIEGEWRRVAARLVPGQTWEDERFKYRRVRGTWDTVEEDEPAPLYDAFCRWTAREAFGDYPEATRVRVRRERFISSAPWEKLDPTVIPTNERILGRDATSLWALR